MRATAQCTLCKSTALVSLVLSTSCVRGVPAPEFTMPFDSVPRASILTYIEKLDFDTLPGSGDEQVLLVGRCPSACRPGPQVALQPERKSNNNAAKVLNRPGRIIARLINRDKEAYPMYNLGPRDTVFWAVDQVKQVTTRLSTGRSLFISLQGLRGRRDSVVVQRKLYIDEHPDYPYQQSLARWIPVDQVEPGDAYVPGGGEIEQYFRAMVAWANCKSGGCCR